MGLPPVSLEILASLDGGKSVRGLAEANRRSVSSIHKALRALLERGLVSFQQTGGRTMVFPAGPELAGVARSALSDIPRSDWGRILYGDHPLLLHVLDRVGDPILAAQVLGKSRSPVYRAVQLDRQAGLLVLDKAGYRIHPRLQQLSALVHTMARITAHHHLQTRTAASGNLIWHLGPELLYSAPRPVGQDPPGALGALGNLGMRINTGNRSYYHAAKRPLTVADAILTTLLIDPTSKTNRQYAAIAFEKFKPQDLQERARFYGLADEAQNIESYVRHHQHPKFLPWNEHERLRELYGVSS